MSVETWCCNTCGRILEPDDMRAGEYYERDTGHRGFICSCGTADDWSDCDAQWAVDQLDEFAKGLDPKAKHRIEVIQIMIEELAEL